MASKPTAHGFDADAIAAIRKYAAFDDPPEPAKAKPIAPVFAPLTRALAAGEKLFSEVFGWEPANIPNIPVRVYADTDWSEDVRPYIPAMPGLWTWPKQATEYFALAMYANDRTLVHGPTGSGKSALIEAFCALIRMPMVRVTCHRDMQSTDFLGKDIIAIDGPTGKNLLRYEWSMTTLAARSGAFLLIDEAFRSPCLMAIQSLLERNGTLTLPDAASLTPGERKIVPPATFRIALTDNTNGTGDDSGSYNAEVQDLSTLGRITATIHVPYMTVPEQIELLQRAAPAVPVDVVTTLAQWAGAMRDAFESRTVMQPVCMRVLLSILAKFECTGQLGLSVKLAYLFKLGNADRTVASEAFLQVSGEELA